MFQKHEEKLLIITKTYPLPSRDYIEHVCVVAINENGEFRRLYPIPFRLLDKDKQFKRWQWISAKIERSSDQRPESHNIDCNSIKVLSTIAPKDAWNERLQVIDPHMVPGGFPALEARREQTKQSIGIIKPHNISLKITPDKLPDWTAKELQNLQKQGLFESDCVKNRHILRKVPIQFRYFYECETATGVEYFNHLVTDWEVGALYWNCVANYGGRWEEYLRMKLEGEFRTKDLRFLMGTIHRFPKEWLIVGLIYPPAVQARQFALWPPSPDA
jgi:hypothetical protein